MDAGSLVDDGVALLAANKFGVEINTFGVAKARHRHVILNVTYLATHSGNSFPKSVTIALRLLLSSR